MNKIGDKQMINKSNNNKHLINQELRFNELLRRIIPNAKSICINLYEDSREIDVHLDHEMDNARYALHRGRQFATAMDKKRQKIIEIAEAQEQMMFVPCVVIIVL